MDLSPRDPDWNERIRSSFAAQKFMVHLGAQIAHLSPGAVDLELKMAPELTQQHGYFHAGATSSIADSAAGYAALSLFAPGFGVLTSEYKINLLNPANQPVLLARGRVVKPGRTLTIARADVYGLDDGTQVHVATGLFTLMSVSGVKD
ncbi:PaaI family thioesterase [Roseibium sediminicola]|uniref:Medium/long-chain acyl-CoA thioesterase YigI n=1 Tax=Roseibium sediminicola TaxID=2933272 RepID=A0ABT0GRV5_9HYPH|nr:PaaI family thioesterase [Roseibium sp. CAU 1639]MCK7612174.1 PaaI family thioesterase [Roseibium sp. CAU 1639]